MIRNRRLALVGASLIAVACARGHEPATAAAAPESAAMIPAVGRQSPAAAPSRPALEAPAASVDPAVIAALNKMGAFLRTQQAFAIRAENAIDEILDTGQKVQFGQVVEMWVRR